jgi:hypothetical protein
VGKGPSRSEVTAVNTFALTIAVNGRNPDITPTIVVRLTLGAGCLILRKSGEYIVRASNRGVRLGRAAHPWLSSRLKDATDHFSHRRVSQITSFRVLVLHFVCEQEMTARPTPRYFLHWTKRFRRPFLRLLLVTIALFVIVPQMSSVDSDEDGIPDLPAIAMAANSIGVESSSTRKDSGPQEIQGTVVFALAATLSHRLEGDRSDRVFHDGRSVLQSSCALRC